MRRDGNNREDGQYQRSSYVRKDWASVSALDRHGHSRVSRRSRVRAPGFDVESGKCIFASVEQEQQHHAPGLAQPDFDTALAAMSQSNVCKGKDLRRIKSHFCITRPFEAHCVMMIFFGS